MLKESRGSKYVKYDPTYVYQAGMETYGLIPRGGNIYATLAERSAMYQNTPQKHRGSEDGSDDSDDLTGNRQIFITCGEDYDFSHREPLNIALSHREAEFLKQKIVTSTQGSLLSYLLDSGLYENVTEYLFDDLGNVLKDIPEKLYHTYRLALRYSRFACFLRVRYAMLYDIAVGAVKAAEDEKARFEVMLNEYGEDFRVEAIEEIIRFVSAKVTEESCKAFILKASKLIADRNFDELDRQIILREKTIKGLKRSKLINAKELQQGKPFESPTMMAYRWNTIVSTVLTEIKEGLRNE